MTTTVQAFAAARAKLAMLDINPLFSSDEKKISMFHRQQAEVLAELEAAVKVEIEQDAERQMLAIAKLDQEKGVARSECLTAELEVVRLEAENKTLRHYLDRDAPVSAREKFIEELRNEIDAKDARIAELEAAIAAPAKRYAERNPLGGPAVIFDAMADRVRAGEDFYAVLADHGFAVLTAEPASFAVAGGGDEEVDYCKELPDEQ